MGVLGVATAVRITSHQFDSENKDARYNSAVELEEAFKPGSGHALDTGFTK
jgi:hypothetical protein